MTQIPDDELISAYLDGELSGEELSRAEQLLATQPETRQLLEELTALRASLQSLPKNTLGAGFSNRVLRRAEREMLQPSVPAAAPRSTAEFDDDHPRLLSWQRWQRPLAWSALAIAAGLLIMAFSPDQPKVALAPAPQGGELTAAAPRAAENEPAVALATRDDEAHDPHAAAAPMAAAQHAPADEIGVAGDTAEKDRTPDAAEDLFDTGDDRVLIVQCDVTARADAEAALRNLLATEQIAWQSQMPRAASGGSDRPFTALKKAGANKPDAPALPEEAADAAAPDAIYIVAEKQQLQTALDSLQATGQFRNVTLSQRRAPADALATYDELSNGDQSTTRDAGELQQEKKALQAVRDKTQNQLGRALQLPLAEAQTNLQLPDVARAADVTDAKQESTSPAAQQRAQRQIPQAQVQQAMPAPSGARQYEQRPAQVATPNKSPPNVQSAPRQQQALSGNTSRALIILRVAPEDAATVPAEPPAKQE